MGLHRIVKDRRTSAGLKLLAAAAVLVLIATTAGPSTWAAFRNTTANSGNSLSSGTVKLTDNDGGSTPLFSLTGLKRNDTDTGCIKVTYNGSLPADVRLYGTTTGTGLDAYTGVTVTRGKYTGAEPGFDSCTNFTADSTIYVTGQSSGVVYSGTLQDFPDSYGAGIVDPLSSSPEDWTTGESHVYKIDLAIGDNRAAEGKNATQQFTWEARNTTGYKSQILSTPGLGAYWRLGEASGTTARDAAGTTDGTYTNGPTLGQSGALTGDSDKAVSLDGVNDYVNVGDVYDFSGTASFSAEAWINRGTVGAASEFRRILSKDTWVAPKQGWDMQVVPDSSSDPAQRQTIYFERKAGGTAIGVYGTTKTVAGTWYHVVATYDGSTERLYVNGALEGTATTSMSMPDTTLPLRIGAASASSDYFDGQIDEAAVYNVALTPAQIAEHYRVGTGG